MGEIIDIKNLPEKMVSMKVLLSPEEVSKLKGHMKNLHLFTSDLCTQDSKINTRGINGVTKYFKIPLSIRPRKKYEGKLTYQKIETPSKIFYIYTIKKEKN